MRRKRRHLSDVNNSNVTSSFLNQPRPPAVKASRPETYLTRECWEQIRHSSYYSKDYEAFAKIKAGPFNTELYMNYPPPPNAM